MKIYICLSNERYYDHDDILEEDPKLVKPYIEKFVPVNDLREILENKVNWVKEKISYAGQLLYKILFLIVKRNALFSKETLEHKVREKVEAYKDAHGIHYKAINVFALFKHMYEKYAETAAMLAGFNHYHDLPENVRHDLEYTLYTQIGVLGT